MLLMPTAILLLALAIIAVMGFFIVAAYQAAPPWSRAARWANLVLLALTLLHVATWALHTLRP